MWIARRASTAAAAAPHPYSRAVAAASLPVALSAAAHHTNACRLHVRSSAIAHTASTPRHRHLAHCPLSAAAESRRSLSAAASAAAANDSGSAAAAAAPATPVAADAAVSSSSASGSPSTFDPSRLSGLLRELHDRGMIADLTNPDALLPFLQSDERRVVYAGFDPTASSLHIGNLLVLMVLRRFQQWGHKPVCVVGGATGMIGDPSGRSSERNLMSEEQLQRNIAGITNDIRKFLAFETDDSATAAVSSATAAPSFVVPPPALPAVPASARSLLLNNSDWFSPLHVVPFLRDVGRHFRMGPMLAKESVSARLNSAGGMSFTEFTYQLLQAYDFAHLHRKFDVSVQIGGSDQWGNITAGIDLIQRQAAHQRQGQQGQQQSPAGASGATAAAATGGPQVFGLTLPLLTTSDGHKFGKSMGNAPIWLAAPSDSADPADPANASSCSSSPYELYQYFLTRTADCDVVRFLKLFTDHSLADIDRMAAQHDAKQLCAILAESVTRLVHGDAGLAAAQAATRALFGGQLDQLSMADFLRVFDGVPSLRLSRSELLSRSAVELAVAVGACKTKAEARRLVASGGLYINNAKVDSDARRVTESDLLLGQRVCVLRSGKKKQFVLMVTDEAASSA